MDTRKLDRLVLRLGPGELLLAKVATEHSLVMRRDASDSNKLLFGQATTPDTQPDFVIHRISDPIANGQPYDGRLQRQRWRHRTVGEVSGGI